MKRKITLAVAASAVALMPIVAQAANKLIVKDLQGTNDKFVVTDGGYVGLNTTAPQTAFHAVGPALGDAQVRLHNKANTSGGGGGYVGLFNRLDGTLPLAGNRLGYFMFGAQDPVSNGYKMGGGMSIRAESAWTASSIPTYFTIETAAVNETVYSERVRVSSAGNMGIGTKTPTQKLEINGGMRLNTVPAADPPTCNVSSRGTFWFKQGGTGTADSLVVCAKDAGGNYLWHNVTMVAP